MACPMSQQTKHWVAHQLYQTKKVIHLLSGGADSIPAEVYKEGGTALTEKLHQLFTLKWQQETIPQEFNHACVQTQREPSVLRKPLRHFTPLHRRRDTRKNSAQSSHTAPRPETPTREPIWILERAWNYRHGVRCKAASREMSGTKCRPVLHLRLRSCPSTAGHISSSPW